MAEFIFEDSKTVAEALPTGYLYNVGEFNASITSRTIYANLLNESEVDEWVVAYQRCSHTQWNVFKTYPNTCRLAFRKDFICHHSSKGKVNSDSRKRVVAVNKNTCCKAAMKVRVFKGPRNEMVKVRRISL